MKHMWLHDKYHQKIVLKPCSSRGGERVIFEQPYTRAYSEFSETSKSERFAKKMNGFYCLTISAKCSIVDV